MSKNYNDDDYDWDDNTEQENNTQDSAFYQPRQYDDMVETQDYTDVAEEYVKKKKNKALFTIFLTVLVVAGLVYGTYNLLTNNSSTEKETANVAVESPNNNDETEPIEKPKTDYKEPNNPATNLIEDAPKVKTSETKAFADGKTVKTSDGNVVSFKGAKVSDTVHECVVKSSNDFCNVASVKSDDKEYYVYYLKDAAHSRFFENPSEFKELNEPATSALATIDTLDGKETNILLIVNDNSSGFMILSSENSKEDLKKLSEKIEVL